MHHITDEVIAGDWTLTRPLGQDTWTATHNNTGESHDTRATTVPDARQFLMNNRPFPSAFQYTLAGPGSRARTGNQRYTNRFIEGAQSG